METLSTDTEQLIKNTAKNVFFKEGKLHATTQDIADAAGINRASIHYYYRSRKQLFDRVFAEALTEMQSKLIDVLKEDLPLRQMTGKFIDFFLKKSMEHPFLELFLVTELNTNPDMPYTMFSPEEQLRRKAKMEESIAAEVVAGKMKPIKSEDFIVNLMALCSFPFMAKPIVKNAISMNEEEYVDFIRERKEVILKLIFLDL
jgi:AcrR family transcriptional regulator